MLKDEVLEFLHFHGIRLNTDAGQHFLIDEWVLEEIIEVSKIQKSDHIWEVGPGIGILTRELLKRSNHVTSVELDPRFPLLIKAFLKTAEPENEAMRTALKIIQGNALDTKTPEEPYKVIANIPYHITSPLLRHCLLDAKLRPTSMTLLVQQEVAENICSGESDSILTVLVRLFGRPEIVCSVPPACFLPPPEVDSSVIHLSMYNEPLVGKEEQLKVLSLAKHAMSQRRKMLRKSIGNLPKGIEALKKVGIDETRRPQTMSIEEWIALSKTIQELRT